MDIILVILGLICCILGLFGSVLPALPGPPISWLGLLLLYLTNYVENNHWILGITFLLTVTVSILDYVIPAKGTKKYGGTKYGVWGTNIGLVIGLFFPPIGFIIGLFVGAFIGELIYNFEDKKGALKAATGAFLGFLVSTFMKFMLCLSFLILFLIVALKNYSF
jgi:uncharacterized protein YqgC (DUF456 family)